MEYPEVCGKTRKEAKKKAAKQVHDTITGNISADVSTETHLTGVPQSNLEIAVFPFRSLT